MKQDYQCSSPPTVLSSLCRILISLNSSNRKGAEFGNIGIIKCGCMTGWDLIRWNQGWEKVGGA